MPYSLFLCLKLLAKSRKEGVTEFVLDVFRECFGVEVVGQDPRPIKQPIIYDRRCHLTEPDDSIWWCLPHFLTIQLTGQMSFNDFVVKILKSRPNIRKC